MGAPPNRIFSTDADFEEEPAAKSVRFDNSSMYVLLLDGRELKVPLILFPRLYFATPEQRVKYQLGSSGEDIHWAELDEDILVSALLLSPEQIQYYNDEFLQRLIAVPETRRLHDIARHIPIKWQEPQMFPMIDGLEELLISDQIISEIVSRLGNQFSIAMQYGATIADEINLANVSPNALTQRAGIFERFAEFISKQTRDQRPDTDKLQIITRAYVYNVDNVLKLPTVATESQRQEIRDRLEATKNLLPSINRLRDAISYIVKEYGQFVGRHPLLTIASIDAQSELGRFNENLKRLDFVMRQLERILSSYIDGTGEVPPS